MKTCTRCGREQELSEFLLDKARKDGLNPWCRTCNREACREYYRKNREVRLARQKAYYERNRETILDKDRADREANPEKERERGRAYYQQNREAVKAHVQAWDDANPEKVREHFARRRARQRDATIGVVDLVALFERDKGICYLCRKAVDPGSWHADHVVPLSRGGDHSMANLRVTHPHCNSRKGSRLVSELAWTASTAA